ncbi:MAG: NmrA/HSCARG family protein [Pseudomonadota bacterium]
MSDNKRVILVFGATGQQGGSVAAALLKAGWSVRALVRDPASNKSAALRNAGAETVKGDLSDAASLRAAMEGVYGVFSVQPSSPGGTVTDDDEIRFGITIADLARACGVAHFVYSSVASVEAGVGLGHFESKLTIEAHIATLPLNATIIRPYAFMEMLVMPGFGLDRGHFNFFIRPDQPMGVLAVRDIGLCVAAIFADPARFAGTTLDLAGDMVTGHDLATLFSEAAGGAIAYARFPDEVLTANPFLGKLTAMLDRAQPADEATLQELRRINPEMQSMRTWLAGDGQAPFRAALGSSGAWAYNQQ